MGAQSLAFEHVTLTELRGLSSDGFNELAFGAILLDRHGVIRSYNRWESQMARRRPESVIGKNFFLDVAPCTDVSTFRGRFDGMELGSTHVFDFAFDFPWGRRCVRIRFLVESDDDRWVFVTDVT